MKVRLTMLIVAIAVAVISGGAAVAAYGTFFNEGAIGTVVPAPATAYLTCYTLDPGFTVQATNTGRPDVLPGIFTQPQPDGKTLVCYLRPPTPTGGSWQPMAFTNQQPVLYGK